MFREMLALERASFIRYIVYLFVSKNETNSTRTFVFMTKAFPKKMNNLDLELFIVNFMCSVWYV